LAQLSGGSLIGWAASLPHAGSFDAPGWLARFTAAGSSYALLPSGRLWLGVVGIPHRLTGVLSEIGGHPDRRAAVTDVVKHRAVHVLADDPEPIMEL
jgi:hypothetical protein